MAHIPARFGGHKHCDSGDVFDLPRDLACLKFYVTL